MTYRSLIRGVNFLEFLASSIWISLRESKSWQLGPGWGKCLCREPSCHYTGFHESWDWVGDCRKRAPREGHRSWFYFSFKHNGCSIFCVLLKAVSLWLPLSFPRFDWMWCSVLNEKCPPPQSLLSDIGTLGPWLAVPSRGVTLGVALRI